MISIWVVVRSIEYPLKTGGQLRRTEWVAYTCTAVDSIACVFYVYIVKTIAEHVWWMSNYVMETPGNESDSQLRSLHFKLPSCILVGTSILCQMHVRAYNVHNWECRSCTQSCPCPWFSVLNILCLCMSILCSLMYALVCFYAVAVADAVFAMYSFKWNLGRCVRCRMHRNLCIRYIVWLWDNVWKYICIPGAHLMLANT